MNEHPLGKLIFNTFKVFNPEPYRGRQGFLLNPILPTPQVVIDTVAFNIADLRGLINVFGCSSLGLIQK